MPDGSRTRVCVACGLVGLIGGALAMGRAEPLTTAQLLVDLARDYALSQRGQQTAADVQHVRTLLQAAVRLDPQLTDAYAWLYELAVLSGNEAEAPRAVTGLLEADPANEGAFALWLSAGLRSQQTTEKQVEWLQAVAGSRRSPALLSTVHVELARLAVERMDTPAVRQELAQALELEPANVAAATLLLQTLDEQSLPAERLRAALRVLQLNPLASEAAWYAGLVLDTYRYFDDAGRFYDYARAVQQQLDPHGQLAGRLLLGLARNRLTRGQLDEATEYTRQAVSADPAGAAEAGMYLYYLLREQGRKAEADSVRESLTKRFAALAEPRDWPVNEVAQAAWFYCTIDKQPHLALPRAESAFARAPTDPFVQRVLGWAQALNLKTDEARRTLAPVAGQDAFAAYLLAKLLLEAGDGAGAQRVLDSLDPVPAAGPAWELLRQLESPTPRPEPPLHPATLPATQPTATASSPPSSELSSQPSPDVSSQPAPPVTSQPASQPALHLTVRPHPELGSVLAEFDPEVLKFRETPAKYVEARVTPDDLGPGPGEPWWVTFSLTNRASFPITLGPDVMVNPVFLVSLSMEGDLQRSYPALMTVSLDEVRVLHPGQTVRVRRTVDVGPIRQAARQTPQQLQRITIQAILDAEKGSDGQWRPSLMGQSVRPVFFNRVPAVTGREGLGAMFSALAGDSDAARVRAIEVTAELLGERQRINVKKASYEPAPVPVDRLRVVLLSMLDSDSWELRVRTLDALQIVGLDQAMVDAVARCLDHPHWLVRLMAVRVLARQGPTFAERAASIARNDEDELVRALAESYVTKWTQPTSQPGPSSAPVNR